MKSISVSNNGRDLNHKALLQGRYEAERLPKDFSPERTVPDFAFNVLNQLGLLYHPVVDEDFLAKGGSKPVWPGGKSFAVCLTHDVDLVTLNSYKQSFRTKSHALCSTTNGLQAIDTALSFGKEMLGVTFRKAKGNGNCFNRDPLHCYEKWLEVEKDVGAHSTFFFWPGWSNVTKHHSTDCGYELTDRVTFDGQKTIVAGMIREIDSRGWEIGLHSSWYSFNDVNEMKRQKEALEKVLDHDILSVRQHFLHYDIRVTPRIQAAAGFRYDATLGFNDNIGFRFGTCYPWNLYDLSAERELPIIEVPLIIQDRALLNLSKGMRLDEEMAFQYVRQIADAAENVGGVLTLLWHPNAIIESHRWSLYLRTLEYLRVKHVWFGRVRDMINP